MTPNPKAQTPNLNQMQVELVPLLRNRSVFIAAGNRNSNSNRAETGGEEHTTYGRESKLKLRLEDVKYEYCDS